MNKDHINYRLIIILLFLCVVSIILSSCKSAKTKCEAYSIRWNNREIDSLCVKKDDLTYIPFIPVLGASQFHISMGERGTYQVILKDGNDIVEERILFLK